MTHSDTSSDEVTPNPIPRIAKIVLDGPLRQVISMPPKTPAETAIIRAVWRNESGSAR